MSFSDRSLVMADCLKGFEIPRTKERLSYYRSESIEIFDNELPEKVSFHVFSCKCMHAAMLPSYSAGDPCVFSGSINILLCSHVGKLKKFKWLCKLQLCKILGQNRFIWTKVVSIWRSWHWRSQNNASSYRIGVICIVKYSNFLGFWVGIQCTGCVKCEKDLVSMRLFEKKVVIT